MALEIDAKIDHKTTAYNIKSAPSNAYFAYFFVWLFHRTRFTLAAVFILIFKGKFYATLRLYLLAVWASDVHFLFHTETE